VLFNDCFRLPFKLSFLFVSPLEFIMSYVWLLLYASLFPQQLNVSFVCCLLPRFNSSYVCCLPPQFNPSYVCCLPPRFNFSYVCCLTPQFNPSYVCCLPPQFNPSYVCCLPPLHVPSSVLFFHYYRLIVWYCIRPKRFRA
jgi:hypothetical protein